MQNYIPLIAPFTHFFFILHLNIVHLISFQGCFGFACVSVCVVKPAWPVVDGIRNLSACVFNVSRVQQAQFKANKNISSVSELGKENKV